MTESCVRGRTPRKSLKIRDLTPKLGVPSAVVIGEWNAHQFDLLLRKRVRTHTAVVHVRYAHFMNGRFQPMVVPDR